MDNSLEYFKAVNCKVPDFDVGILVVQQLHSSLRSKLPPVFKHHIHLGKGERQGEREGERERGREGKRDRREMEK